MTQHVQPIPEGYHSISPILVIRDAKRAIDFYQKAFGAKVLFQQDRPDGELMHAAIKIGDSIVMLGEECAPHEGHEDCVRSPDEVDGTTVNLYLYVNDVDDQFRQALDAGAQSLMHVEDMFWGDRVGMVRDPFGHIWSIAAHTQDLTEGQMQQRMQEFFKQQAQT